MPALITYSAQNYAGIIYMSYQSCTVHWAIKEVGVIIQMILH